VFAEGRGGPEERPLHPWQQALEPVRHWVRQVSEPGELVVDPFLGSGTTAVAAVMEGRRFIGCDSDPGCVETTRRRLEELAARPITTKPVQDRWGNGQAGGTLIRLHAADARDNDRHE
jgi:DNA modification methylase